MRTVDIDWLREPTNPQRSTDMRIVRRMLTPDEKSGQIPLDSAVYVFATRDGMIVDGVYRWKAAKLRGDKQINVLFVEETQQ